LQDDIHEYEALKRGEFPLEELRKVSELPKILIKARIAQGISPKELADRLDLDEQDIQQYEANDYASATLGRISDVAMVLMIYSRTDLTA
jgi:ribosome-binding protein aMBF1 (putative translation factor)